MMMPKRIFNADTLQHIYQNTYSGNLIFYCTEDFLLYYTVACIYAKKYNIKVVKMCLMVNHIHLLLKCHNNESLRKYISVISSVFVKEYNKNISFKKSLFRKGFGCASKEGGKRIRSCAAYIDNNPVEKKLCMKAEDYRWNFLAYYNNKHPFSEPIVLRRVSSKIRKSINYLNYYYSEGKYLNYCAQNIIFSDLDDVEREQVVDYIINLYNVIDYTMMVKYYGSFDEYLTAVHSNTGSEYDIEEDWNKYSDAIFYKMMEVSRQMGYVGCNRKFHKMDEKELRRLVYIISNKTHADEILIARFLHLDVKQVSYLLYNHP